MKIRLPDKRIVAPWKTRILSLLQTQYTDGITTEDVLKVYPTAPKKYIDIAIKELADTGVADQVTGGPK